MSAKSGTYAMAALLLATVGLSGCGTGGSSGSRPPSRAGVGPTPVTRERGSTFRSSLPTHPAGSQPNPSSALHYKRQASGAPLSFVPPPPFNAEDAAAATAKWAKSYQTTDGKDRNGIEVPTAWPSMFSNVPFPVWTVLAVNSTGAAFGFNLGLVDPAGAQIRRLALTIPLAGGGSDTVEWELNTPQPFLTLSPGQSVTGSVGTDSQDQGTVTIDRAADGTTWTLTARSGASGTGKQVASLTLKSGTATLPSSNLDVNMTADYEDAHDSITVDLRSTA